MGSPKTSAGACDAYTLGPSVFSAVVCVSLVSVVCVSTGLGAEIEQI